MCLPVSITIASGLNLESCWQDCCNLSWNSYQSGPVSPPLASSCDIQALEAHFQDSVKVCGHVKRVRLLLLGNRGDCLRPVPPALFLEPGSLSLAAEESPYASCLASEGTELAAAYLYQQRSSSTLFLFKFLLWCTSLFLRLCGLFRRRFGLGLGRHLRCMPLQAFVHST